VTAVAAVLTGLPGRLRADSRAGVCTFGVFPYVPALKIGALFAPMAEDFGAVLGIGIQLRTNETFDKFRAELCDGRYDIALVHPFLYVEAHREQAYAALARVDQELAAVIVSRRDQPVASLAELRGARLALPPRGAGVSYLLRSAMLEENLTDGVDLELRHYQTKVSCLHAVATDEATGCVVPSFLGDQLQAIGEMQLVPIWQSRPIKSVVVIAHPRLPDTARAALRARMIGWRDTDSGRSLLERLSWPGMVATDDAEFDEVRAMSTKLSARASG
jgi:phosphonate transport system substrate-binding protein